ncbi:unnamed protein product [Cuscuta europaea]|uniref:Uncharacterized protein n=1 Tax=Cuscuta europaea TaxID=41803 RepID=A0A9P0ZVJ6_CUSEU|nr:unnamed protein product [Cuscuta europaea]
MGKKTSLIMETISVSSISKATFVSKTAIMERDSTLLFMYCAVGLAGSTPPSSPSKYSIAYMLLISFFISFHIPLVCIYVIHL